jgi:hypothetical protein
MARQEHLKNYHSAEACRLECWIISNIIITNSSTSSEHLMLIEWVGQRGKRSRMRRQAGTTTALEMEIISTLAVASGSCSIVLVHISLAGSTLNGDGIRSFRGGVGSCHLR